MCRFNDFVDKNYKRKSAEKTIAELGHRNFVDGNKGYLGITDILPSGCDEKTILSKTTKVEHDLEQLIVFGRGHLGEDMVADMFDGLKYKRQVEVLAKTRQGIDIKGHIDFVLEDKKQMVVVEVKTTSSEIDAPYESWIFQVQAQIGFLKRKYPNKIIRGYVFAINMNNGWHKAFLVEFNELLFDMVLAKADELAQHIIDKTIPKGEAQLYCSKCSFKGICKTLNGANSQELPADVKEVVKKIVSLASLEKEIRELKSQLKDYMVATETTKAKADDNIVSLINVKGKRTVDVDLLKNMMPDIYTQFVVNDPGYCFIKVV